MSTLSPLREQLQPSPAHAGPRPQPAGRPVQSLWRESVLLVLGGSLLLLAVTQPAFGTFFFGENFLYLGQYWAHGSDYWQGLFSPNDVIWFRPVFFTASVPWHFLLPLDPWAYHVRNFAFAVLNLLLLHRVLVHLAASRAARILALLFFAVSKVHLTTIGYINIYDSLVMLMLVLATLLCFLRYIAHRRTLDYGLGLMFCFLTIFSKEYGVAVVGVLAALVAVRGLMPNCRRQVHWWALRLAPLPAMGLFYFGLHRAITGPAPSDNPVYSPQFSPDIVARNVLALTSTMVNLSFSDSSSTGAGGLGAWLSSAQPEWGPAGWVDSAIYVSFLALLLGTLLLGRHAGRALFFPLVWIAASFAPTLLTSNFQMYYLYDSLAGTAVLLGVCLDRANRRLLGVWGLALVVIGANGAISNNTSVYGWQFVADSARRVQQEVLEPHRGEPLESMTFITASRPFWRYTLAADSKGPMIPELMKLPALRVDFIDYQDLAARQANADAANLFIDIDNGLVAFDPNRPAPAISLRATLPAQAEVNTGFNVQPDGQSALGITAENATPGTAVVMDGMRLATTYGDPTELTALVPTELLARPGSHTVYLSNGVSESNRVEFVVSPEPPTVPNRGPLLVRKLDPPGTRAGKAFNVQPSGQAALSVDCENAPPGTVIVFGDTPLATTYGSDCSLTALVPAELYRRPGRYEIYLKRGTSESDPVEFVVDP